MSYECSRCGKTVPKLVPLGDAYRSSEYTHLLGIPNPCIDYFCVTCAREIVGISDQDLVQEERITKIETEFLLNFLKGRLAQVLIETILREFGYEVYPYSYESYLTGIIGSMRKGGANIAATKVRVSPDIFVYDRELNEGFLSKPELAIYLTKANFGFPNLLLICISSIGQRWLLSFIVSAPRISIAVTSRISDPRDFML